VVKRFRRQAGGIDWYCELRGDGPHVVLIPSGEGDCESFAKTADMLAGQFTVLTFDTPGFSRTSPPPDPADISFPALGPQVADLVHALGIERATFYGCSSGGVAVLDLLAGHAGIVRNGIVHEPAVVHESWPDQFASLEALAQLDDASIVGTARDLFANTMNEDTAAWKALGTDYHKRLDANYITWVRHYFGPPARMPRDPATFTTRPITWTLGALTPMAFTYGSLKTCEKGGINWSLLPSKHFPQVSVPEVLAGHITKATTPHLS
jgi:pimeloyl-ACP methyl ester carboxylesterase